MRKHKAPKFNAVLEDFRKFAGMSDGKTAEEQCSKEKGVSNPGTSPEIKDELAGGGQPFGATTDAASSLGHLTGESYEGKKSPSIEEHSKKEVPASSKVAEASSIVNDLLATIDNAMKAPERSEQKKQASANENDDLSVKVANHIRNMSVGYELGRYLFGAIGQKQAEEIPQQAPEGDEGDEITTILQAIQELVAEGQIDEAQAQEFLMSLEAAIQGGGAGAPEEVAKTAAEGTDEEITIILQAIQELVAEGQIDEAQAQEFLASLEAAIQGGAEEMPAEAPAEAPMPVSDEAIKEAALSLAIEHKVAQLSSMGYTDDQISYAIQQDALKDAETLKKVAEVEQISAIFEDALSNKVAGAIEAGATEGQVVDLINHYSAFPEVIFDELKKEAAFDEQMNQVVYGLKRQGYSEAQVEEYIKRAAYNDAMDIAEENEKASIRSVVEKRAQENRSHIPEEHEKIADVISDMILEGKITQEEGQTLFAELL